MNTIQIEFSFKPYLDLLNPRFCYDIKTCKPITEQDIISSKKCVKAYKKAIRKVINNGTMSLEDCYDILTDNLPSNWCFVSFLREDENYERPYVDFYSNIHQENVVSILLSEAVKDDTLIFKNRQWQKIQKQLLSPTHYKGIMIAH